MSERRARASARMATANENGQVQATGVKMVTNVKLIGKDLTVELSPYQIGRMNQGACSTFTNNNLIAIAVAHSTLKELNHGPGDVFFRNVESQYAGMDHDDDSVFSQARGGVGDTFKTRLTGPASRLIFPQMRVIIFKQMPLSPDNDPTFIHACYDAEKVSFLSSYSLHPTLLFCFHLQPFPSLLFHIGCLLEVCFVSEGGKCLYIFRAQLIAE